MKSLKHIVLLVLCIVGFQLTIAQPTAPSGKKWEKIDILSDEFNGNTIDANKWDDFHPHWSGRAPSRFKKGNAFVDGDGYLKLRSTVLRNPSTVNNPLKDIWVNSAACVSKGKTAKPGYYYEARFKASSLSMTSSFWFRVGQFSEIDVIEHIGNPAREDRQDDLPFEYAANTHYYGPHSGLDNKKATWRMPVRARDGFHTYGFWWKSPNELLFYYDGQQVMRIVPRVPLTENLKMIFDTEVFPFAQAGVPNIGLPKVENLNNNTKNTMLVDWVRSYKLVDCNSNCGGNPDPSNGTVTIKGQSINKFISSENGNRSMRAVSNSAGGQEKFIVKSEGNGTVSFKGNNGKYVSSEDGKKTMNCNRNAVGAWEKFTLVPQGGNVYAIRGNNGKYVSHENGSTNGINCNRNAIGAWEKFVINGLTKSSKINNETIIANNIKTYPNPVKTNDPMSMSFKLREETKISVELFNIIGQSVLQNNLGSFKEGNHDIKLFTRTSQLNSGLYLLKIRMNDIETVNALEFK